jgi:hypothetical protein
MKNKKKLNLPRAINSHKQINTRLIVLIIDFIIIKS